jgi:hypothetical protein
MQIDIDFAQMRSLKYFEQIEFSQGSLPRQEILTFRQAGNFFSILLQKL